VVSGANRCVACSAALSALLVFGCKPNLEGRPSLIDTGRVLAVQSVPAEQVPDDAPITQYLALYASPIENDKHASELGWAFCNIRKPLAVIGPSALECLAPSGKGLRQIGQGEMVSAPLDKDACSVFGPTPAMASSRPADPDTTGGYYQPIRVLVPTDGAPDYVVGVTRLSCGVANVTQDQAIDFATRYRPNENPVLSAITLRHANGHEETLTSDDPSADISTPTLKPGERITFHASWASCPTKQTCGDGICGPGEFADDRTVGGVHIAGCPDDCTMPKGCTGAEPYVALDPVSLGIVDRREAMLVAWFVTDGTFDNDATGRTEQEAHDAFSENEWVAPVAKGTVHFWFVLRDDRGGVGWTELSLDVGS